MRIIYDNAIDRATLTPSSTAGVLAASRMQNDEKAEVWRSTGTSATITATWPTAERIGGVGFAFANLSSSSTCRVRIYELPTDTSPVFDQIFYLVPGPALGSFAWGVTPLGQNSFIPGGGTSFDVRPTGAMWVDPLPYARRMVLDVIDTYNVNGYLEVGKLFAGRYWQPEETADRGAPLSVPDLTTQSRSDSGSLRRDRGPQYRKMSVSLSWLSPVDRERLFQIAYSNGVARSLFVSLYPENTDKVLEQAHQLWGCLVTSPQMSASNYLRYAASLDFEEI